jgi:hypothetical protein
MHARKASCIGCTLAGGVGDPPVREWQFLAISEWMDPATTDDNVAWARETFAAMLPFTANQLRYMNYLDEDDMRGDPTRTAYGPASGLSAGDLPGSTACSAARRAVRGVLTPTIPESACGRHWPKRRVDSGTSDDGRTWD